MAWWHCFAEAEHHCCLSYHSHTDQVLQTSAFGVWDCWFTRPSYFLTTSVSCSVSPEMNWLSVYSLHYKWTLQYLSSVQFSRQSCPTLWDPMNRSTPVPTLPRTDAKNWLIGKDPDAGKDWRREEKGMTEDEMVGWHHRLDGHEFEQAQGVGDGQGSLVCCSSNSKTRLSDWSELP